MWHTYTKEKALDETGSNLNGLSSGEILSRQKEFGANKLSEKKRKTVLQLFMAQLKDWLIFVLLAAVVITFMMGEFIDGIIILAVVFTNAALGVAQELKAGKAIQALQKLSSPHALVKRDGQTIEIDATDLVPGDVVVLDAGRYVPADLRLMEAVNLRIEESALTGESVPVEKDAEAVLIDKDVPLGDIVNMAFMSTLVTNGRGSGLVVKTGMQTEIGSIADMLDDDGKDSRTPLEIRLNELGKTLAKIALGICVAIFIISIFQGRNLSEMFLTSVSLAVASIPEGLAAIVAVVLSIGVTAMSKRNAIVKKLPAVETLGSVNIICTDKTGTLTLNKMQVTELYTFDTHTELESPGNIKEVPSDIYLLAKGMLLCNDATLEAGKSTGDPTEIALLQLADGLGLDRKHIISGAKRIKEVSFDSVRKMMTVLVEENGEYFVFSKGALASMYGVVDTVFTLSGEKPFTPEVRKAFSAAAHDMSEQTLRTLALAYKKTSGNISVEEMEQGLTLVGITGMYDPPRLEAKPSIELAKKAGITPVMITGDHKDTAFSIAKDLGIAQSIDEVITGNELAALDEEETGAAIEKCKVFARVSPEHKVRIVNGFKAAGNIVSMTGDGVNDAPSLKDADIGVAMGITGTDVAKGAADIILTDDNFTTIVSAIEQGRNIYNNIKKAVVFLLSSNLGEVITMLIALLIGWQSPFIATQLLWINLLTDSLPAIALGMAKNDPAVMNDKPRKPKESFFARGAGVQVVTGGLVIGLVSLFAFWFGFYNRGYSPNDASVPVDVLHYARTLAFLTLIAAQLFYALSVNNMGRPFYKSGMFTNSYLTGAILLALLLQLLVVYIPMLRDAFKLVEPSLNDWLLALGAGIIPMAVSEVLKLFKRN